MNKKKEDFFLNFPIFRIFRRKIFFINFLDQIIKFQNNFFTDDCFFPVTIFGDEGFGVKKFKRSEEYDLNRKWKNGDKR